MNNKILASILGIVAAAALLAGLAVPSAYAIQVNGGFGGFNLGTVQSAIGANSGNAATVGNLANINACGVLAVC